MSFLNALLPVNPKRIAGAKFPWPSEVDGRSDHDASKEAAHWRGVV